MSLITTTQRAAAGVGAAALIGLALGAPAVAGPASGVPALASDRASSLTLQGDPSLPNPGPPSYNTWANLSRPYNPGPPSYNSWPNYTPPSRDAGSRGRTATPGSGSLQYVQIGLGALGGAALAAVSAFAMATRQRRQRTAHA